ncbi:MAG: EcsC family protein [Bacillota bacterium]|nr:EcsC family protein [Bacillota bacterium]
MKEWDINTEWQDLLKEESKEAGKRINKKEAAVFRKIKNTVPSGVGDKLESAFAAGFELVFKKGVPLIECTYDRKKFVRKYRVNSRVFEMENSRENLERFTKQARKRGSINRLISGAEGIVLGVLGIGIPDIPVFIGVLLKNVYEIAMSFGFSYEGNREKLFILDLIRTALCSPGDFERYNNEINSSIDDGQLQECSDEELKARIKETASVLADRLLYLKFIQGIPVAGALGGISDLTCVHSVTEYALLKYRRRFIILRMAGNR